jgi:hypothetical protein
LKLLRLAEFAGTSQTDFRCNFKGWSGIATTKERVGISVPLEMGAMGALGEGQKFESDKAADRKSRGFFYQCSWVGLQKLQFAWLRASLASIPQPFVVLVAI